MFRTSDTARSNALERATFRKLHLAPEVRATTQLCVQPRGARGANLETGFVVQQENWSVDLTVTSSREVDPSGNSVLVTSQQEEPGPLVRGWAWLSLWCLRSSDEDDGAARRARNRGGEGQLRGHKVGAGDEVIPLLLPAEDPMSGHTVN